MAKRGSRSLWPCNPRIQRVWQQGPAEAVRERSGAARPTDFAHRLPIEFCFVPRATHWQF